jgi:VCBS repeat-containing protein
VLTGYPDDSCRYYVPYHGRRIDVPGVWVRESDGAWLARQLAAGPVRVRLTVDATDEPFTSHNIVGELPGADDEVVIVGSHHDGPWASAVEDGSGIALVLAQAEYWSRVPAAERPHRLVFLLQGGHMSGGAGLHGFIEAHRAELDRVVLEVHLEHACVETAGSGEPGRPVPRWFFTSEIPRLEAAVLAALQAEDLRRSMILPPTAIGEQPPTDGGYYANEGVPIVNFLSAPWYLFDEQDTLDKVDRDALLPLTRATVRMVESTRGVSAAAMRQV